MRTVGWVLIALQFVGLAYWSTVVVQRAAMAWDFSTYFQPWYEIAHLHLDPTTTMMPYPNPTFPFWQYDGELLVWLLAPLYWLFPNHELGYWWLQDVALTALAVVCYRWIGELVPWSESDSSLRGNVVPAAASLLVVVLLIFNPWIYWSATFAVQMEPFGALFAVLTLRALTQNRNSVWAWALLTALCGSAELIYLIGAGLAAAAVVVRSARKARTRAFSPTTRRRLLRPALVTLGAVVWILVLSAFHGTRSVSSSWTVVHKDMSYLLGQHANSKAPLLHVLAAVVSHPGTVLSVIGSHAPNVWANVAPGGILGLVSPPGFFLAVPTLLENSLLHGQDFSYPGLSNLIVYPALAVGTPIVIAAIWRRRPAIGIALSALVAANAITWFVIWLPKTGQYVTVDAPAAAAIRAVAGQIPPSDEVIASQGFVGNFAARADVYVFGGPRAKLQGPEPFPVLTHTVWFAISANQGIEAPSTSASDQAVASVARLPGIRLIKETDGVWFFRWVPPTGIRTVELGGPRASAPAWLTTGVAGRPVLSGSASHWYAASKANVGYVVSGDIWRVQRGAYVARVVASASKRINVEVWDDAGTGDRLLVRRTLRSSRMETVTLRFHVARPPHAPTTTGPTGFDYIPVPPVSASTVEIRIWSPGRTAVRVVSLSIVRNMPPAGIEPASRA